MPIARLFKPLLICVFVLPLFFISLTAKAADDLETLMQVDRDFAAVAVKSGVTKAFADFMAADGIELGADEQPTIGYEAVMSTFVDDPNTAVTWAPEGGDISGGLGYTWGRFTFTNTADDGSKNYRYGKYLTVWKRQADGTWKVALDIGNNNPKPE